MPYIYTAFGMTTLRRQKFWKYLLSIFHILNDEFFKIFIWGWFFEHCYLLPWRSILRRLSLKTAVEYSSSTGNNDLIHFSLPRRASIDMPVSVSEFRVFLKCSTIHSPTQAYSWPSMVRIHWVINLAPFATLASSPHTQVNNQPYLLHSSHTWRHFHAWIKSFQSHGLYPKQKMIRERMISISKLALPPVPNFNMWKDQILNKGIKSKNTILLNNTLWTEPK